MNREEGETKRGAEKMALFFIYPISLISFTFLGFIIQVLFLCFIS